MFQQYIALIIIAYFVSRVFWQRKRGAIGRNEFVFWLVFWFMSAAAILSLGKLDTLVARLGFSASGIEVLLYLAVAVLFYLLFRIRLRIEKIEKNITTIVRRDAVEGLSVKDGKHEIQKYAPTKE